MDEYRTLQDESRGIYREKGSRFIAVAMPAGSVEEVKAHLEQLRREFHDARHHCYAYRIGIIPGEYRYQDDGEPSGTAGKPIFGQIQSYELTNILLVVIRYFGGIKLGTSGLIQAYRAAARDALQNGAIVTRTLHVRLRIRFNYSGMNAVMKFIKEEGLRITRQETGEECTIFLEIRKDLDEFVKKKLYSLEISDITVI